MKTRVNIESMNLENGDWSSSSGEGISRNRIRRMEPEILKLTSPLLSAISPFYTGITMCVNPSKFEV